MTLCQSDIDVLRNIATGKIADDANLNDSERRSARYLYQNGYINAYPVEGADASIEVLSITEKGKRILARGRDEL